MPEDEIREFFEREFAKVVASLGRIGFPREIAQDATQEGMTAAWRRWSTIRNHRAWVWKAAYHYACHMRRDREVPSEALPERNTGDDPRIEVADAGDEWPRCRKLLGALRPREREVLALRMDGFPAPEIAEILDIDSATVRSTLRNARATLKPMVGGERGDGAAGFLSRLFPGSPRPRPE